MGKTGASIAMLALLAATSYLPLPAAPLPASAFVDARGAVWSWADDGSASGTWTRLPGVSDAVAVAISGGEVLIARLGGGVDRWRGVGTGLAPLRGLSDVRQLSCGPGHCLALTAFGRVFAWGANDAGQIGDGSYEATARPVAVVGLPEIVGIAAGGEHSLALADDMRVFAWGGNSRNQLGLEGAGGSNVPVAVEGIKSGRAIAAGAGHSLVVLADGRLMAGGASDLGQLGLGYGADVSLPTEVPGIRAAEVATRGDESYVTLPDGSMLVFGRESSVASDGPMAASESARVWSHSGTLAAMGSDGSVTLFRAGEALSFPRATFGDSSKQDEETPPPASPVPGGGRAALVIGGFEPSDLDRSLERRLWDLGLDVRVIEDRELTPTDASSESLVVFSPSADGPDVDPAIGRTGAALVSMDPYVLMQLGLASERIGTREVRSGTTGVVVNGDHPLGADGEGEYALVSEPEFMPWATPNENAQVVAVTESGRASIYGFEAGANTPRGPAPARRAAMLLPETASRYRGAAWVLFDASIRWALGEAPDSEATLATLSPTEDLEPLALTGGSGTILLVVGNLTLTASDQTYKTRMEAMGFTVQVIMALNATAGSATGKKMVFVASSSPNADVGEKFRLVTVPVLVQNSGIVDDMSMTGATAADRGLDPASTEAVVVTPTHPIAGLLTGTQTIGDSAGAQNWGIGSTNAQNVLRHTSNSTHATLFGYEQGVAMVGLNAPNRRVLYGFQGPIPETFTAVGGDIFDRTIFWTTKTNIPPAANAGPDQATTVDVDLTIIGSVLDEGLPNPPGAVSVQWSVFETAPNSQVTFVTSSTALTTTVRMNNTGAFILRLSASDDGVFWTFDDVVITVFGEDSNQPPTVNAGPDQVFDLASGSVTLTGAASDEGLPNPPGALSLGWSKVSGPGTVTFGSATQAVTTASFSLMGTYVLRLTANDCDPVPYPSACASGGLTNYDDVVVSVQASALLVVGNPVALTTADSYLKGRIEALGFPVVLQAAATSAASQATGRAFVWVTHSSPNGSILAKFRTVTVPVVVETAGIVDDMSMTSGTNRGSTANQTQGVLPSPPTSPLSGGVAGTVTTNTTPINHDWGTPSANGVKVVTQVGNVNRASVFSYEKNVTMVGFTSPERRVFFGMWALETPTPEAKRVLDATILWLGRTNAAPWPNAGPDLAATLSGGSAVVSLAGSRVDDGLPNPPAAVTTTWTRLGGPAPVTFGNASSPSTTATFTVAGDYVLKLTASDGALSRFDTAVVSVLTPGANAAPAVGAGPDRTVRLPFATSLTAVAGDDGLPNPALTYAWTKVSGPGTVTFGTPSAKTTTASFSVSGIYVLRVTVNDGAAQASDDVQVTVEAAVTALLVVGSLTLPANDAALKARLEQFGTSVTVKTASQAVAGDANGKAIVVISDTVDSNVLLAKFRDTATPVLCQEPNVYDDMKMTGTVAGTDYGTTVGQRATIVSTHALAARLSGTVWTHLPNLVSQVFGVPVASAIKVAVVPSAPTQALLFAYPEGVTMVGGFVAPGRRVGMLSEASSYTAEAWALFDAAVKWLTERRVPALLVTGSATLTASDLAIRDRLLGQGYPTTVVTSQAVTSSSTVGMALVFIAPSANPGQLNTKLRDVAVPILTTGAGNFPNMGLTGGTSGTDFDTAAGQTKIAMTSPLHPLGVNLSGTPTVVSSPDSFSWGVPGSAADVVSTLELDSGKATTFGYEAGDVMVGVSAPERRVGLWLGPGSAQALTADGSVLVDAGMGWAFASDGDRDGLGFLEEFRSGTSPADPDSNDDGILDGAAVDSGVSGTNLDTDGDGLTNALELTKGTDPFRWDTDGDAVGDAADCFPLDATRTCVPPTPGDVTPPGIILTEPTNAVFVSTVCTPSPCPP